MGFNSDSAKKAGAKSSRKGVPNRTTSAVRSRVHDLVDGNFKRYVNELDKLEGKDYVSAFHQLMEYTLPKLQRIEGEMTSSIDGLSDPQVSKVAEALINNYNEPDEHELRLFKKC